MSRPGFPPTPVFVGIDVAAAKPCAVAALTSTGWVTWSSPVSRVAGALRLSEVRASVFGHVYDLQARYGAVVCAAVEVPFSTASSFVLPAVAGICLEAVQSAAPGAVVLDRTVGSWRKDVFGRGNLKTAEAKQRALELAAEHGLREVDDDMAEAACLALLARDKWLEVVDR